MNDRNDPPGAKRRATAHFHGRPPQAVFKASQPLRRQSSALRSPVTWGALAVLIGISVFLFSGTRKMPVSVPPEEAPPLAQATGGHEKPAEERIGRAGDSARAIIADIRAGARSHDLEELYTQAGQFLADQRLADAHLLYFFTARTGHAASAFVLAEMFDPNYFTKDTSLLGRPDPVQASKWYRNAANNGYAQAGERLKQLKQWVVKRASTGDPEASRLLLGLR
ncbi:MAG: hypothetical protein USCGTAYLOR_00745 [Chromatiales bacterium USCg_Taylor]|nr:MAG: hypothetical protein USCGTAYLOR_00745 [Chromatiales bacterium USCg_Taylor]